MTDKTAKVYGGASPERIAAYINEHGIKKTDIISITQTNGIFTLIYWGE